MKATPALRIQDYLEHILQAISRINRYVAGLDRAAFLSNTEKQDAVIRNIEILGEAANNIRQKYADFASKHPEFPWAGVYGMRNAVAHGYFSVDIEIVWATLQTDLPELERLARMLLDQLESQDQTDR